ncbi:VOC family protein [Streptomyces sp. RB110-1]|uniref:VOC family protein n=1 Tax=unclassified Streptomyces TaxID=2593676 RepID=UPI0018FF159D|nr:MULTISPECIES: VOC family protein [unclassified Streptomyces]MBK0375960.1 VOC family protein [Streptomyces sp. RB110-1]MBK0387666.1 VOC family protein [Streptomyces sp. RB110-2]
MAVQPEGTPCWADAMFVDVEGAKSFYGDVLGWTFGESASEFGDYTQAFADGRAAAAVVPPMPGADDTSAWCLYFASPDAAATAARVRDNGGEVLMEPMRIGDFGTMALARDPGGAVFGIWQAGRHEGFETEIGAPGGYCWSEVFTRDPQRVDAFYPAVFPYTVRKFDDESMDFTMFDVAGRTVLGRMAMGGEFPPEVPSHVNVYFAVPDCDAAVAKATARGGELRYGPTDSPFGRFATISDPQGAAFAVIDLGTTVGRMPASSPAD